MTGTLEWKPSDAVHSVLDLYYSRFKQRHDDSRRSNGSRDRLDRRSLTYSNVQTKTRDGVPFRLQTMSPMSFRSSVWDEPTRVDHLFSAGLNNDFGLARPHASACRPVLFVQQARRDGHRNLWRIWLLRHTVQGRSRTRDLDNYDRVIPADDFPQMTGFGLDYADANQVSLGDRGSLGRLWVRRP